MIEAVSEVLFLFVLALFVTVIALFSKVYGYKIIFGLLAGVFWFFTSFEIETVSIKVLFAFAGVVFLIMAVSQTYSFASKK